MPRRCLQVSTGSRGTYRDSFLFWWGQKSFFCIKPLRLAIKTTHIDFVLILFMDHNRILWKCQIQATEKWNPLFILILASSTHLLCLYLHLYGNFSSYCHKVEFKIKKLSRILFKNSGTETTKVQTSFSIHIITSETVSCLKYFILKKISLHVDFSDILDQSYFALS